MENGNGLDITAVVGLSKVVQYQHVSPPSNKKLQYGKAKDIRIIC